MPKHPQGNVQSQASAAGLSSRLQSLFDAQDAATNRIQGALDPVPLITGSLPTATTVSPPTVAGVQPAPVDPPPAQADPQGPAGGWTPMRDIYAGQVIRSAGGVRPSYLAQEAAGGFVSSVTGLPAMAVDALNAGLGFLHPALRVERPYGGSEQVREVTDWFITGGRPESKLEATNAYEKIFGRVTEEIGLGLSVTGAAHRYATHLAARAPKAYSALRVLAKDLARMPVHKVLALETAVSAGAGLAGGTVGHITDSETADMYATLVAAFGFPIAGHFISRTAGIVRNRPVGRIKDEKEIEFIVGKMLSEYASNPKLLDRAIDMAGLFRRMGIPEHLIPDMGALGGDPNIQSLIARYGTRDPAEAAVVADELDSYLKLMLQEGIPGIPKDADVTGLRRAILMQEHRNARARGEKVVAAYHDTELNEMLRQEDLLLQITGADSLDDALTQLTRAAETKAARVVEDMESRLIGLDPGSEAYRQAVGKVIAKAFDDELDALREAVGPVYDRIAQRYGHQPTEVGGIYDEAVDIMRGIDRVSTDPESIPDTVRRMIDDPQYQQGEVTFERLQQLRTDLLGAARKSRAAASPNPALQRNLQRMTDRVEETMDRLGNSAGGDGVPGLREVNRFYRIGKQRLSQGRAALVQRGGPHGEESRIALGEIARKFFLADSSDAALDAMEQYRRAFGGQAGTPMIGKPDDPRLAGYRAELESIGTPSSVKERIRVKGLKKQIRNAEEALIPSTGDIPVNTAAEQAMDDFIVDELVRVARDNVTHRLDPVKVRQFMGSHREALSVRPQLKARLMAADGAQEAADASIARAHQRAKEIRARVEGVEATQEVRAKAYEESAFYAVRQQTAGAEMEHILGMQPVARSIHMKRLLGQIKTLPKKEQVRALNALRRQFYDKVTSGLFSSERGILTKERMLDEDAMRRVFEDHGDILSALYGDKTANAQREYIGALADAVGANRARLGMPGGGPGLDKDATRLSQMISKLTSRVYAWKRGVVSGRYLVTEQVLGMFNRHTAAANTDAIHAMLTRAMYDPAEAKRLIDVANAPTFRELEKRFLTLPIFIGELGGDQEFAEDLGEAAASSLKEPPLKRLIDVLGQRR